MKACVLERKKHLVYKEVNTPQMQDNAVLVRVKACGICSSDFARVYGDNAYFFPIILGHEFSGQIVQCGKDINPEIVGRKIVAFPLLPCMHCEFCEQKSYAQCINYNYFGSRCNGAMAEYIVVPLWNIKFIPQTMPYQIGALCEPTAIAIHALNKIENLHQKNICIVGTGIIGILCGLIAKQRGAKVSFTVRSTRKKEFLQNLGFTYFVTLDTTTKFDTVLECVGSNASIGDAIALTKSKGDIIFIGNPAEDILLTKTMYWKILRSELRISGVWNSDYKNASIDDWDMAIDYLDKNKNILQKLITHKFQFSDAITAFNMLQDTKTVSIKGVFINE